MFNFLFSAMSIAVNQEVHQSTARTTPEESREFESIDKQTTAIIMVSVLGGIPSVILLCCILCACWAHMREKTASNIEERPFVHPAPTRPPPKPRQTSAGFSGFRSSREGSRQNTVTPSFIKTAIAYNSMNQKL